MQATLPTGLVLDLRGMKVREQRIFADRRLAKKGGTVSRLVEACTTDVIDAGPYTLTDGKLPWSKVAQGDMFAAALAIRVATYGPEYSFSFTCDACGEKNGWKVDVLADLEERKLEGDDLARFIEGNRFETKVAGATVVYKIATRGDEQAMAQNARRYKDAPISGALITRIVEIRVDDAVLARSKMMPWLEDLEMGACLDFVSEMEAHDCGIDTTIAVECSHCGHEDEIDIPFAEGFWLPKKRRKTQGR